MKKLLVLILAGLMISGMAMAENNGSGCGLGKAIFQGKKGLVMHVLAATTNGFTATTFFGLTSGTSGCDADSVVKNEYVKQTFVAQNMDNLSRDMAQGQGEYVFTLASLMGCPVSVNAQFGQVTQAHFDTLMPGAQVDAPAMLGTLKAIIQANPQLAQNCTNA